MAYFNFTAILTMDLTLLVIGQYLLPVLFLIYLIHRQKGLGKEVEPTVVSP
jgi:hypothetical protein